VVNREVQPRRAQQTDVWVEAPAEDERPPLRVVIEAKGCWHQALFSAMEEQLLHRYMLPNGVTCGVYLVGWFLCEKWSDEDSRLAKARSNGTDREEVTQRLNNQAESLAAKEPVSLRVCVLDATWPVS
jgi:hypothetical protein